MNKNPEERAARFRRFPQEAEWVLEGDYPDPQDVALIRQIARDESHGDRAREWAKVLRLAEEKFNRPETLEDAPGQDLCDIRVGRKLGEPEVVVLRSDYYPANLRGAALRRAKLYGRRCACGADLRDVRFGKADLRGANLRGADLTGADMSQCALAGADLREVVFGDETTQEGANLQRIDFRETRIEGVRFVWCNLAGADFRDMDLSSVSFIFCRTHGMRDGVSSKDGSPLPLAWRPAVRTSADTPGMSQRERWAGNR